MKLIRGAVIPSAAAASAAALEQEQTSQGFFASLVRSCGRSADLVEGRRVHQRIINSGNLDRYLGNLLVEMYGKCSSLEDARSVFDSLRCRNVYSWTIMLNAYVINGQCGQALQLFHRMDLEGERLDDVTFLALLGACSSLGDLRQAKSLHRRISESGIAVDVIMGSALVNLYCKCGSLEDAMDSFAGMSDRNVVSWSCLIAAHVDAGRFRDALGLYRRMQCDGLKADRLVFASVLEACAVLGNSTEGATVHECVASSGLEDCDAYLRNGIITMYGKWGLVDRARQVFFDSPADSNVVSWTALVSAYAQNGQSVQALELYRVMNLEGVKLDRVAFVTVLDAAAANPGAADPNPARALHQAVAWSGLDRETVVGNSLVNLYGRCGRVEEARLVFDRLSRRDVVSWGSMMTAYGQNGDGDEVLKVFNHMDVEGAKPDAVVFIAVLDALTSLSRLSDGKALHSRIASCGFAAHEHVHNSLINMYSKCGRLEVAEELFRELRRRDTVSWNSVVISFARHGDWPRARRLYREMQLDGSQPSAVTLVSVLSACRHAGLVEPAREYFLSMVWDHGIVPGRDHYGCMIDLLGKAGWLKQAEEVVQGMPVQPATTALTALLGACKIHGDVDRANATAEKVVAMDPSTIAGFVLLSNSLAGE